MQTHDLNKLMVKHQGSGQAWLEFFRVSSLSMGVYHLKAGQEDKQQPHTEDEVYLVISGRAWFRCHDERLPVGPGKLIFVQKNAEHRFYDISEDLTVLVFFAPAEGSAKT